MIVVFVIDNSPSMGEPLQLPAKQQDEPSSPSPIGMSRLDLAKMTVESLVRMMDKRIHDHNAKIQMDHSKSLHNLGFGYAHSDQFLLLSTGCCEQTKTSDSLSGAGNRLLVGFDSKEYNNDSHFEHQHIHVQGQKQEFDKELKRLRATKRAKDAPFPEDGGGAVGLNAALSTGLLLLSRHRLQNRYTENFGLGRLPANGFLTPNSNGGGMQQASQALQPACLILLTDGECLRKAQSEGGGPLQLQFGNIPLREFYREPFRWDQRIFCLGVGPLGDKLHPSLRAFADISGGCHSPIRSVSDISQITYLMSRLIAPPLPPLPIINPLRLPNLQPINRSDSTGREVFVNGGPVCCFQTLERSPRTGQPGTMHRAMLLYTACWVNESVPSNNQSNQKPLHPIWAIPESYFSSKKLDTLPPRSAQPVLNYTRFYQAVGTPVFDPIHVMKLLHRLDQFIVSNRGMSHGSPQMAKLLQRDVYVCQWLSQDGRPTKGPSSQRGMHHFPICVRGAGRNLLSDGEESVLNIGILHIPEDLNKTPSTLTLLPPEPHILLPLLLRSTEMEHRLLKKASSSGETVNLLNVSKNIPLDENWRTEMRAYLFRVPPYYQAALKRCLRSILPFNVHSLLSSDAADNTSSRCLSRQVILKIRSGEQIAKDNNERLERREREYRRYSAESNPYVDRSTPVTYGQYDSRSPMSSYLNALRKLPPPSAKVEEQSKKLYNNSTLLNRSQESVGKTEKPLSALDCLGDLPAECLLAFYESRRRWIFGGEGLTTKGISVAGVHRGTNSHFYRAKGNKMSESLLSVAGVGASSLNRTPINKMGDFKERLLFTNQPIIGHGCNDSIVSPISTRPDGSPSWSLSDESLPITLFDPTTGEFNDSAQARVRARLMINFGNPFKDKRGSIVPEKFMNQRPPAKRKMSTSTRPQGSPPHDFSSSVEGEGEAEFAGLSPPRLDGTEKQPDSPEVVQTGVKKKIKIDHKRQVVRTIPSASPDTKTAPPPPPIAHSSPSPSSKKTAIRPNNAKKSPSLPRPPRPKVPRPPPPPKDVHLPKINSIVKSQRPPPPKPTQSPGSKQQSNKQPAPAPVPQSQNPNNKPNVKLPDGWICVWSKSQKKWYFFNKETNKSVWEWPPPLQPSKITPAVKDQRPPPPKPNASKQQSNKPSAQPLAPPPEPSLEPSPEASPAPPYQNPNVKPNIKLPDDWICVWSKSQKKWYFFDKDTNKSVWEWPPPSDPT